MQLQLSIKAISIHAPHEGCDREYYEMKPIKDISIHAPHEGCDEKWFGISGVFAKISIHAPHEGCDNDCRLMMPPRL